MKNEVRIVGTFEYQEGKLVSVDQNRRLFDAHKAVPIPANQIGIYYPLKTASSLKVGSGFTSITLRSGETYPAAISARRVILEVSRERVIFVEHSSSQRVPSFFIQTPYEVVLRDLNIVLTPQKKQAILGELRAEPVKIPAIFAKMIKQLSESPQ
jgi:predicted transcriptional regulator